MYPFRLALVLAMVSAATAGEPADDPDAVVFLGLRGGGEGAPAKAALGRRAVLTNVADRKEWRPVLDALAARGFEAVVAFRGNRLDSAFRDLARAGPAFVAVVVPPNALDVNFHFDLLERASRLDDDPFVDFAFGYVTGATPEEALAFLEAGTRRLPHTILAFGPSTQPNALTAPAPHTLAKGYTQRRFAHPADAKDVAATLAGVGAGILQAWGHGYPDGVHEGLKGRQIRDAGLDLAGALYFSGPCYCGVTGAWYSGGRVERKEVAPEDSFVLALIRARAGAVFAGLDPDRGETSEHELEHLLLTGAELGLVSKSTYDDCVLAYRRPELELPEYRPGKADPHRDIHDTMIAGGACRALFGDPTARPVEKAAEDAFAAQTKRTKEGIEVRWTGGSNLGWMAVDVYRANGMWTHRIRLRADLPLEDARQVQGLKVLAVTKDGAPARPIYATGAVEAWGGAARVHLMVVFPPDPQNRVLWGGRKYEARFLLTFAKQVSRTLG